MSTDDIADRVMWQRRCEEAEAEVAWLTSENESLRRNMACGEWGYSNDGCRCQECTSAHRTYMATYRARKHQELKNNPEAAPHGLLSTYQNYGCRCEECKAARAAYFKARR